MPIDGWTLLWQYSDGQEISRASNVLFAQHGELVMMTNTGLNKVIPAGAKLSGITDHLAPRAVTILCGRGGARRGCRCLCRGRRGSCDRRA